jgi:hypothetical protein
MLIGNIGVIVSVLMTVRSVFSFPDPVNETSARLVATGVVLQGIAYLVFREGWLLVPLVYGFVARVSTGPSLSPLGQLSTRVMTPFVEGRLGVESRRVPGPPKRFAQAIGLAVTAGAAVASVAGASSVAFLLIATLVVAALLEAALAICLGCIVYAAIWGCADCDDISERLRLAVLTGAGRA